MSPDPTPSPGECAPASEPDLLEADDAAALAAVFTALSDPTRVRLFAHISAAQGGTVCACHLPEALGISQPTLSHHLKKLTSSGLVLREQRGRWAHYTAAPGSLDTVRAFLERLSTSAR